MNAVSKVWFATCQHVYEVLLLEDNTCRITMEPGNDIPTSMKWGRTGTGQIVFQMNRMPEDVDQLPLPAVVAGGIITGNKAFADQVTKMLSGVVNSAAIAVLYNAMVGLEQMVGHIKANIKDAESLPTPIEASEVDNDEDPAK